MSGQDHLVQIGIIVVLVVVVIYLSCSTDRPRITFEKPCTDCQPKRMENMSDVGSSYYQSCGDCSNRQLLVGAYSPERNLCSMRNVPVYQMEPFAKHNEEHDEQGEDEEEVEGFTGYVFEPMAATKRPVKKVVKKAVKKASPAKRVVPVKKAVAKVVTKGDAESESEAGTESESESESVSEVAPVAAVAKVVKKEPSFKVTGESLQLVDGSGVIVDKICFGNDKQCIDPSTNCKLSPVTLKLGSFLTTLATAATGATSETDSDSDSDSVPASDSDSASPLVTTLATAFLTGTTLLAGLAFLTAFLTTFLTGRLVAAIGSNTYPVNPSTSSSSSPCSSCSSLCLAKGSI
jgi:hypothetical protein